MCNQSPAKLLRSVRRITRYIEKKPSQIIRNKPVLSIFKLPQISLIPLKPNVLSITRQPRISIASRPRISFCKLKSTEIVPGSQTNDELLFSSYIDGATFSTTFICHVCYDDYNFQSAVSMRAHIQDAHRTEMYHKLKKEPPFKSRFEDLNW